MEIKRIIIVPKISKFEWDMHRLGKDEKEIIEFYKKEGISSERIIDSHTRQKEGLEKLKKIVPDALVIHRDSLTKEITEKANLVISYGGDNHFQYVSHFLDDTPILGINSDPIRSEGALTSITIHDLKELKQITEGKLEEWPRLLVSINEKAINTLCISDIYIGEQFRYMMSRLIINHNGKSHEQKGSGLIIATGSGSSGWYHSASRYLLEDKSQFKKTAKEARFIFTEPYDGKLQSAKDLYGVIKDDEVLEVTSLCDSQAILSIDSLKVFNLPEGAKIKINFNKPLKVLKTKDV